VARPAPGVDRVVRVLDFLAAHPDERFTLSELARRLELNKATAHALLVTLTDSGYLLRHPTDMTYSLGPALIALGSAAQARFPAVDFARDAMRSLSEELGLEVLASAAVDWEIVVLARAGTPLPLGASVPLGQRLPIVPPLGSVFVAWADDDEVDEWLRRVGPEAEPAELDRHRASLVAIRDRGYAVALEADAREQLGDALAQLAGDARAAKVRGVIEQVITELSHEEYLLGDLDRAATYRVNTMGAPVFGPGGDAVLALFLVGFRGRLTGAQIEDHGKRLLQATRTVTKSLHGRAPKADA
jgi:DNA-binding IclR family transcriptional regulator